MAIMDDIRIRQFRDAEPEEAIVCDTCEGSGWEMYGLGRNDPHFRECQTCHNPSEFPSP